MIYEFNKTGIVYAQLPKGGSIDYTGSDIIGGLTSAYKNDDSTPANH